MQSLCSTLCNLSVTTSKRIVSRTCALPFRISMTMPVSVAAGERIFSKLKLIKTYLRSTMNQERLTVLAILSTEQGTASSLLLIKLSWTAVTQLFLDLLLNLLLRL